MEQLVRPSASCDSLPPSSPASLFLNCLLGLLATEAPGGAPPLGRVLRVPLPAGAPALDLAPMRRLLPGGGALGLDPGGIQLEVPPDMGNGAWNAGISLARLLW